MSGIDKKRLIQHLRSQFKLDWQGLHGISHWTRVRVNGLMLARETGANPHVIELFAFFHDARRFSEQGDAGHGARGAELAAQLRGRYFEATDTEMTLLHDACAHHSDGLTTGDITVLTCWDADRLDLGRVGIMAKYLCTDAARKDANRLPAHQRALAWMKQQALAG